MRSARLLPSLLAALALGACGGSTDAPAVPAEPPLTGADLAVVVAAERELAQDRPEAVEALLTPLLAREHPPAKALFDMGWADYNLARYGECIERMERAVEQDPALLPMARVLGFAHYKLGAYDRAREVFEAIVAARPDAYKAHYGLGQVALTEGRMSEARAHLERALALEPGYLKARFGLARVLHDERRDLEALDELEHVLRAQPSHEEAIYVMSQVLANLGRTEEAAAAADRREVVYAARDRIGAAERRIRAGEDDPLLFLAMAEEFVAIGDAAEASRVLRDGLRRHPGHARLAEVLAQLSPASR